MSRASACRGQPHCGVMSDARAACACHPSAPSCRQLPPAHRCAPYCALRSQSLSSACSCDWIAVSPAEVRCVSGPDQRASARGSAGVATSLEPETECVLLAHRMTSLAREFLDFTHSWQQPRDRSHADVVGMTEGRSYLVAFDSGHANRLEHVAPCTHRLHHPIDDACGGRWMQAELPRALQGIVQPRENTIIPHAH